MGLDAANRARGAQSNDRVGALVNRVMTQPFILFDPGAWMRPYYAEIAHQRGFALLSSNHPIRPACRTRRRGSSGRRGEGAIARVISGGPRGDLAVVGRLSNYI
jgi:hypothetical protein